MTEINYSQNYLLDIDFHTDTINQYKSLDSIQYSISAPGNSVTQAGVLPIKNGKLSIRSYSPGIYRAQCTTEPRIQLGKQKQGLNGTFIIYATDINNQPKPVFINDISLAYHKPKLWGFF
ncbi:hypothetical protein CLV45_0493 [Hymenobacter chitinivorans DSM 11115]|uniref:Uncharacterized protein n=2 Tax=Hymenobacter chitinivorans TaxID=89969 RepID=A0A2M9BMG1_9BACT|nr:hypothetical protein CLV45_0493 [Hymenobacter chitinivorans DSM 11115]